MTNCEIKALAKAKGVKLWMVAEKIGLHDSNFSKMLRKELPTTEKEKIVSIISELERKAV